MKKITEQKFTVWASILSLIPHKLLPSVLCLWIVKYGILIRFKDEPWTRPGFFGNQADFYSRESIEFFKVEGRKGLELIKARYGLK